MQGKLFIISGCSGVGKGTLLKMFLEKNPDIKLSISATTRKPRNNEIDGINYFFTSKEDFEEAIKNNEFLEYAQFSENFYGTKRNFVEKTLNNGNDLILEIEVQGAKQVKEKMPDAVTIFIMPPNVQTLEIRLRGRHTEDEETIQKRLNEAKREIEAGSKFDYKVINDELEIALSNLQKIIDTERNKNVNR
ncbi:guanylate kinase [bacterium]|nr:guanylate kinase [bacterium]